MIAVLVTAIVAVTVGGLAGWIAGVSYEGRFVRRCGRGGYVELRPKGRS
jgi:hypothetical protein